MQNKDEMIAYGSLVITVISNCWLLNCVISQLRSSDLQQQVGLYWC